MAKIRLALIAVILFPLVSLKGESTPELNISIDEIFQKISPQHPRLMAKTEDFQAIREAVTTKEPFKKWWQKIQAEADKVLKADPAKYELEDGVRLLSVSRRVLVRSQLLGVAYQITGDAKYKDRLWQEMEAIIQFPDWHPVHFLDVAELTNAASISYDWLYNDWTPEQRSQLKNALVTKGLQVALQNYKKNAWWSKCEHNWNQVCNGGMGIGALAVADEEPELAKAILQYAIPALPLAMRHYAPDGAWGEGPGYWEYATSYTVYFLSSLKTATGSDWGLSQIPGFSLAGDFPLYLNGTSGASFNFADAGDSPVHGAAMYWLAEQFVSPEYAIFEQTFSNKSSKPMDLIWGVRALSLQDKIPSPKARPLNKYFRETEVAILRGDRSNPDSFYVGFKSGSNRVNHSHLDCGSFILDAFGKRWGLDLGPDNYNLPAYFGKQRWTYYRLRAEGHNTLVFNPDLSPDQNPKADTKIIRFSDNPENAFAIADLTPAYSNYAQKVHRGIALKNGKDVLVQDEIESGKVNDLWWFFHTQAEIKLQDNGKKAVLNFGEKQLQARLTAPSDATFEIMEALPLPSSPHPEKQFLKQPKEKIRKLSIHLPKAQNVRIAVQFSAPDSSEIPLQLLDDWK